MPNPCRRDPRGFVAGRLSRAQATPAAEAVYPAATEADAAREIGLDSLSMEPVGIANGLRISYQGTEEEEQ